MPTSFTGIFRENVAALIIRGDGRLLIGECADKPGSWSFPQGGVDEGETRREALYREIQEEIGLRPRGIELLGSRSGYNYSYPPGRLKKGLYRGQMQTYFLCRLRRGEPTATPRNQRVPEFISLRWIKPASLDLRLIPGFKREVIRQVMADFFSVSLTLPDPVGGSTDAAAEATDGESEVVL